MQLTIRRCWHEHCSETQRVRRP